MELQDGTGKTVLPIAPPISYLIEERCETRSMAFGIPTFAPTGTYHLHYITSLQVNPVRQVRQAFTSTEFEIVENESLKMDAVEAAKLVLEAAEIAKTKLAKEKN
jgi:hypothetical protein